MILLDEIVQFCEEAGPELAIVYVTAIAGNNRSKKFDAPFKVIEGKDAKKNGWDLYDFLGDWAEKAQRVTLDGRGVKATERVLYRTVRAPIEDDNSSVALVNALERTTLASVGVMEQSVESSKALTAAVTAASDAAVKAIQAAGQQLDKVQELFISEIKDARSGERAAREAVLNERDGKHTAELAFAEAEAEHKAGQETVFESYAKDPKKIAALFLLAKQAAGFLLNTKETGLVKALTDGAKAGT